MADLLINLLKGLAKADEDLSNFLQHHYCYPDIKYPTLEESMIGILTILTYIDMTKKQKKFIKNFTISEFGISEQQMFENKRMRKYIFKLINERYETGECEDYDEDDFEDFDYDSPNDDDCGVEENFQECIMGCLTTYIHYVNKQATLREREILRTALSDIVFSKHNPSECQVDLLYDISSSINNHI